VGVGASELEQATAPQMLRTKTIGLVGKRRMLAPSYAPFNGAVPTRSKLHRSAFGRPTLFNLPKWW